MDLGLEENYGSGDCGPSNKSPQIKALSGIVGDY